MIRRRLAVSNTAACWLKRGSRILEPRISRWSGAVLAVLLATCFASGAMASITPIATTTADSAGEASSTVTVARPAGVVAGDVLVASLVLESNGESVNVPSGWTLVGETDVHFAMAVMYRIAGASEPANYTFTFSDDAENIGSITAYRGVDNTNPIGATAVDTNGGTSMLVMSSLTTTTSNAYVVRSVASDNNAGYTPPAGYTERVDTDSGGSLSHGYADREMATAGATGTETYTYGQSQPFIGISLVLNCAPTADWDDAPNSYGTLESANGPRHTTSASLFIGSSVDADADGQPTSAADGDGADDDGATFAAIGPGNAAASGVTNTYALSVEVTNSTGGDAMLSGWMDLDCNGTFEAGERATGCFKSAGASNCSPTDSRGAVIPTGATPSSGKGVLYWDGGNAGAPLISQILADNTCANDTNGNPVTFARLRLTTDASFFSLSSPSPLGSAGDGEVEGFQVPIAASTTPAVIGEVQAQAFQDGTVFSWLTASETDVAAFRVERRTAAGDWQVVHSEPWLPALLSLQGGRYQVRDATAVAGQRYHYRVIEQSGDGRRQSYGPYTVTVGEQTGKAVLTNGYRSEARWDIDRTAALAEARELAARRPFKDQIQTLGKDSGIQLRSVAVSRPKQLKLRVQASGLYALPLSTLANEFGFSARTVRSWQRRGLLSLQTGGQEVAWRADSKGTLYFYGEAIDSLFSEERTYWLTRQRRGLKMKTLTVHRGRPVNESFIASRHDEQDNFAFLSATGDPRSDYWFREALNTTAANRTKVFEVAAPGANSADGSLSLNLWGGFDATHVVDVKVNGEAAGTVRFRGRRSHQASLGLPASAFGGETLSVELTLQDSPGRGFDFILLDSFDLDYRRSYRADQGTLRYSAEADTKVVGFTSRVIRTLDITDPRRPAWVKGGARWKQKTGEYAFRGKLPLGEYLSTDQLLSPSQIIADVPSTLKAGNNRADYVIITHAALRDGAEALADYRSRDLRTLVVDVQDIYDEFAHGLADPGAIQAFIRQSQRWQRKPRYVVLVGGGNFDYRNILGTGTNWVSPLMWGGVNGLYASDTLLGDVDGDGVPEVAVGRVPAQSTAEVLSYVDKAVAYESNAVSLPTLLLADNADQGGDFGFSTDVIGQQVFGPSEQVHLQHDAAATKADLLNYLDSGIRLLNYVGHGGIDRLTSEGVLLNRDADGLNNGHTPVFVGLSCIINNFSVPAFESLGTRLVNRAGGGMVAAWAASGESFNGSATRLGIRFHEEYTVRPRLGDAIVHAFKQEPVLSSVYTLLGDPALVVQ